MDEAPGVAPSKKSDKGRGEMGKRGAGRRPAAREAWRFPHDRTQEVTEK